MSKILRKHFDNPFPDYSPSNASNRIINGQLCKDSKIVSCLNDKWEAILENISNLDTNDFSVYTGTSGIALLRLLKNPDKKNLEVIKQLLQLNKLRGRRHSFLCGDAGPLSIGIVVNHRLGDVAECAKLVKKLTGMKDAAINYESNLPSEYLYGRVGYLFALLYVNKHVLPSPIEDVLIRSVIEAVLACGKNEVRMGRFKCPLMYQWHDSYYLGAAHGISGIIYLLIQAYKYLTESELNTLIRPTIDYLSSTSFPSGNYPSSLGSDTDKYVQWCHGAPGFLYMYTAAYRIFKDDKYLNLALKCGDIIWERGLLKKGYSICHGVSGNAYCFLELYQTTKDEKHLYRAIIFTEWCIDYKQEHEEHPPDRPLSLFEGASGPMYLLIDIQNPMEAKFPGYTL